MRPRRIPAPPTQLDDARAVARQLLDELAAAAPDRARVMAAAAAATGRTWLTGITMHTTAGELLTVEQTARRFGYAEGTVRSWCTRRHITRINGGIRPEDVTAYLGRRRGGVGGSP